MTLAALTIALTVVVGIDVPPLSAPVVDRAQLLDAGSRELIAGALRRYQKQSTHQLQVLIVKSLEGQPVEGAEMRVGRCRGTGVRAER